MPFRILSLDGGGIRGIIPASILAELERRADRPISDLFDLVAGTSTGGILALGLTKPGEGGGPQFRAEDLVSLYEQEGQKIFSRSVWHRVRSAGGITEEKYPSDGIDEVLEERFGEARISQAVIPTLVTSYDIEMRQPHFFKSHKAAEDPMRDYLMRDAARATSAAPTYFEPARVKAAAAKDPVALVDGGVFANNPAVCALVEALCFFEQKVEDVVMLSLGTGEYTRPILYEDAKDWGLAHWARPVLDVVFDGVTDTVDYQARELLDPNQDHERYLRMQVKLHEGNDDMDDASRTNLRVLKLLAKEMIGECSRDIDRFAEILGAVE